MDERPCLSSKSECGGKDSDSSFPKVVFRDYDPKLDHTGFICLVNDYFKDVHLKSHNELIEVQGHKVNHIDAKIAEWDYRLCFVCLAMAGDEYAGFMVYESEKDVIAYIRAMYFRPEFRNKNLGFGFQKVIAKRGVKKIIALSYEHNIEFKQTKRKRLICTKDGLNFWDINLDRGN